MPIRYTLRQLEYLVAVGESGSIALAAESLNVSSPSISTAIAQLEVEFGLPIFVRKHAHGMSATQAGRELIHEAEQVLRAAGRLADIANLHTGSVRGALNVGCLLTFAQIVLPQLRRAFVDLYPDVSFHQFEAHQANLIEGLRDARLDVALTYDLAVPGDLEFVELAVLPPFAILPTGHPLVGRGSVTVADLAPLPMILLDLPLSSDYFLSFFERARLKPRIVERTRDIGLALSLVANEFGYSILNHKPLSDRSPDGKPLQFVPLTGPVQPMRMGLLYAGGGSASFTVRAFIDHCRALLPQRILPDLVVTARQ